MAGRATAGAGSDGSRDALRRLDALAQVGLRLARQAPSGRVLLAQLALGLDPRLVPRPWGDELLAEMEEARAASREPLSAKRVEQSLRSAWGVRPREELDDLDPEPVAVTPTSQVHRARHDGAPVAVKVQRPGLARSVRQDLALLDSLLTPLSAAFPALDARGVLAEIGERVRDEFDLEHEAANARRLHRRLRGHPRLLVPAPVARLAGEEVLVSEWIEGTPLRALAPAPGDPDPGAGPDELGADAEPADAATRDDAAAALVLYVLGGGRDGLMNAGLTLDDVLLTPEGRVAVVDHGVCCAIDRDRLPDVLEAVDGLAAADADRFAGALVRLGWLEAEADARHAMELLRAGLGALLGPGPSRLDVDAVRAAGLRALDRQAETVALVRSGAPAPADLWPMRGAAQLFATIAALGADGDWPELVARALSDGWAGPDA